MVSAAEDETDDARILLVCGSERILYFGIIKNCGLEPLQCLQFSRSFLDKQTKLGRGVHVGILIAYRRSQTDVSRCLIILVVRLGDDTPF